MTMTCPSASHARWWVSTVVSCVTVKTKTRSKKSSSVVTRWTGTGVVVSAVVATAGEPSERVTRA
jgi:hypothetical protein